jgi:hypothetical protein
MSNFKKIGFDAAKELIDNDPIETKFRAWDKVKKIWIPGAYGFHILGGRYAVWRTVPRLQSRGIEQYSY